MGSRRVTDILFTLALFCVFAASALIVVYIGADVYRSTVDRAEEDFRLNTTLSFVSTKIRQHDNYGAIRIEQFGGSNALVLEQPIGENIFETWIYFYNGTLRELFTNQANAATMSPSAGQVLLNVFSFDVEQPHDSIIAITAGSSHDVSFSKLVGIRSN